MALKLQTCIPSTLLTWPQPYWASLFCNQSVSMLQLAWWVTGFDWLGMWEYHIKDGMEFLLSFRIHCLGYSWMAFKHIHQIMRVMTGRITKMICNNGLVVTTVCIESPGKKQEYHPLPHEWVFLSCQDWDLTCWDLDELGPLHYSPNMQQTVTQLPQGKEELMAYLVILITAFITQLSIWTTVTFRAWPTLLAL